MNRLVAWVQRHARRSGRPGNHDDARDDLDRRQAALARRLRAVEAAAASRRRPPEGGPR
jgi:hypothetical protein